MLYLDREALETAKNNYSSYAQRMKSLKEKLVKATEEVRGGWDSDAGKAFFEKFDDEWKKNFDDYTKVVEHMADNMNIAKNKYQAIFDQADKLKV